jgi:hypothetical protein
MPAGLPGAGAGHAATIFYTQKAKEFACKIKTFFGRPAGAPSGRHFIQLTGGSDCAIPAQIFSNNWRTHAKQEEKKK